MTLNHHRLAPSTVDTGGHLPTPEGWKAELPLRLHKYLILGRVGDQTRDLVIGKPRAYQLCQPCLPINVIGFPR